MRFGPRTHGDGLREIAALLLLRECGRPWGAQSNSEPVCRGWHGTSSPIRLFASADSNSAGSRPAPSRSRRTPAASGSELRHDHRRSSAHSGSARCPSCRAPSTPESAFLRGVPRGARLGALAERPLCAVLGRRRARWLHLLWHDTESPMGGRSPSSAASAAAPTTQPGDIYMGVHRRAHLAGWCVLHTAL